jgi:hypothetical protein
MAINIAMMAITTNSSINVNALRPLMVLLNPQPSPRLLSKTEAGVLLLNSVLLQPYFTMTDIIA